MAFRWSVTRGYYMQTVDVILIFPEERFGFVAPIGFLRSSSLPTKISNHLVQFIVYNFRRAREGALSHAPNMNLFRLIIIWLKPLIFIFKWYLKICANCSCATELTHSSLPHLWWYLPLVNIVSCGFRLFWPCRWSSCLAHNLLTYCVHNKCWINQPGFVKKENMFVTIKEYKTHLLELLPMFLSVPLFLYTDRQTQAHRHRHTLSWD